MGDRNFGVVLALAFGHPVHGSNSSCRSLLNLCIEAEFGFGYNARFKPFKEKQKLLGERERLRQRQRQRKEQQPLIPFAVKRSRIPIRVINFLRAMLKRLTRFEESSCIENALYTLLKGPNYSPDCHGPRED